jgi:hypothetical protein
VNHDMLTTTDTTGERALRDAAAVNLLVDVLGQEGNTKFRGYVATWIANLPGLADIEASAVLPVMALDMSLAAAGLDPVEWEVEFETLRPRVIQEWRDVLVERASSDYTAWRLDNGTVLDPVGLALAAVRQWRERSA